MNDGTTLFLVILLDKTVFELRCSPSKMKPPFRLSVSHVTQFIDMLHNLSRIPLSTFFAAGKKDPFDYEMSTRSAPKNSVNS